MFFISVFKHTIMLPPHLLNLPLDGAIELMLDDLFLDKVIADLGLCVAVYDIENIEGGFIPPGEGALCYKVVFRLIMFRPFAGEVILAKVKEFDDTGLQLTLGFFDDIYVPPHLLPSPSSFDQDPESRDIYKWIWKPNDEPYVIDTGDEVQFRVHSLKYLPTPIEQQEGSKPFAPMVITGSMEDPGLGVISWW